MTILVKKTAYHYQSCLSKCHRVRIERLEAMKNNKWGSAPLKWYSNKAPKNRPHNALIVYRDHWKDIDMKRGYYNTELDRYTKAVELMTREPQKRNTILRNTKYWCEDVAGKRFQVNHKFFEKDTKHFEKCNICTYRQSDGSWAALKRCWICPTCKTVNYSCSKECYGSRTKNCFVFKDKIKGRRLYRAKNDEKLKQVLKMIEAGEAKHKEFSLGLINKESLKSKWIMLESQTKYDNFGPLPNIHRARQSFGQYIIYKGKKVLQYDVEREWKPWPPLTQHKRPQTPQWEPPMGQTQDIRRHPKNEKTSKRDTPDHSTRQNHEKPRKNDTVKEAVDRDIHTLIAAIANKKHWLTTDSTKNDESTASES